jgi:hypothetical protein
LHGRGSDIDHLEQVGAARGQLVDLDRDLLFDASDALADLLIADGEEKNDD